MDRRQFLAGSMGILGGAGVGSKPAAGRNSRALSIQVKVDAGHALNAIAADFIGLGYETASVATPGLISGRNHAYIQLVRTLGKQGVIRVGGNVSDYSVFSPQAPAKAAPERQTTVVNAAVIRDLGDFLDATGWKLIWGLNLGSGTPHQAVEEAQAVAAAAQDKLLAFEIGNEPDLFRGAHRPQDYGYTQFHEEYRTFRDAIRKKLPNVPFAGPDVAVKTDWVTEFARDEGTDIKLLTHHYYAMGPPQNPASTLQNLLAGNSHLGPLLAECRSASQLTRVPYRICETNSCFGGGKPGVSDTFAAALWGLDFLFTLAAADAGGANLETGVNQHGFISSYSPIGDDGQGHYSAKPLYYGMLAFTQASQGRRVDVHFESSGLNIRAYAVLGDQQQLWVTLINKDASQNVDVHIVGVPAFTHARIIRLRAPSLESKSGVTLGGSEVTPEGRWNCRHREAAAMRGGECVVSLPAASAAIVTLSNSSHG